MDYDQTSNVSFDVNVGAKITIDTIFISLVTLTSYFDEALKKHYAGQWSVFCVCITNMPYFSKPKKLQKKKKSIFFFFCYVYIYA